jgi:hypothetical protein
LEIEKCREKNGEGKRREPGNMGMEYRWRTVTFLSLVQQDWERGSLDLSVDI